MDTNNFNRNDYERPSIAVDLLVFTIENEQLKIVLIKRGVEPFKGSWALPGGFVLPDEDLEKAAKRELLEEAGVSNVYLEQLYTFGDIKRDPRARVVTVAYFALTPGTKLNLKASSDAAQVKLFPINKLPVLAFDHKKIIQTGVERLKNKVGYSNIVFGLLPMQFRLSELQKVYEIILGQEIDKRNFRKKMLGLGLLEATGKKELEGAHRPAMLFKFKNKEVVFFD